MNTGRGPLKWREGRVCGCHLLGFSNNKMEGEGEMLEDVARWRGWQAWLELGSEGSRVEDGQGRLE